MQTRSKASRTRTLGLSGRAWGYPAPRISAFMANLLLSSIGFALSLVGAGVIAWPIVARTDKQLEQVTATKYGRNPDLRGMLTKERDYARAGLALVIAGSSWQFYAAI
jgi:hypothetical protein